MSSRVQRSARRTRRARLAVAEDRAAVITPLMVKRALDVAADTERPGRLLIRCPRCRARNVCSKTGGGRSRCRSCKAPWVTPWLLKQIEKAGPS